MKKVLSIISMVAVVLSFSVNAFALDKAGKTIIIDGEIHRVYDYSSSSAEASNDAKGADYSQSEQDKIDAAWKKALQQAMLEENSQPGELEVVGMINGKPLYAKTEVSAETTRESN